MVAFVVAAWVGMKALSSWWWVFRVGEYSDTYYYFLAARDAAAALASPHAGSWAMTLSQAMPEYPTPAAWLLLAPYLLGADDPTSYRGAIMLITTLADAVFAVVLGRALGPIAVLSWVMLTTALGGLPLLRLDMLPAVAAGVALVLVVQRRGGRAGVAIAVGTALKVWPIIVAPLLFAGRARLRAFVSLAVSGIVLVVLSVTAGGWERLLSPLTYQGDRGLQIEAVAAPTSSTASSTPTRSAVRASPRPCWRRGSLRWSPWSPASCWCCVGCAPGRPRARWAGSASR